MRDTFVDQAHPLAALGVHVPALGLYPVRCGIVTGHINCLVLPTFILLVLVICSISPRRPSLLTCTQDEYLSDVPL
ncbi:hypothetical protein P280DRAFT_277452 [Massarina eburnea CBS 473.64]|uniref:Uncharacterized protein n=1 Tax=Massarina eburnea CBS 473.64 TaxID=1395130 RepID=A0A6A6S558_9PLEO|nr:hypothetical protein P280DRAFT_277452 [Massarina eburnea CBS 473.64]